MTKPFSWRPREDYVVFQRINRGETHSGIHVPDDSLEGVDHVVVAIGPKVVDLKVGDKIIALGKLGADYGEVPEHKKHFLTKATNVVLVFEEVS